MGVDQPRSGDGGDEPSGAVERSYDIEVSTDAGASWRPVAVGLSDPHAHVDRRGFVAGELVEVRVVEVAGGTRTAVTYESFRA